MLRALTLLPLVYIPTLLAAPATDVQIVLGETVSIVDTLHNGLSYSEEKNGAVLDVAYDGTSTDANKAQTWFEEGKEFLKQNGLTCMSSPWRHNLPSAQLVHSVLT
jgi:hypothetical protein